MTDTRTVATVFTAATATALDGIWTTLESCKIGQIRQGHGTLVGGVSVRVLWGDVYRDGEAAVDDVSDPSVALLGHFLRITSGDDPMVTHFLGRIQHAKPSYSSTDVELIAEGILSLLSRLPVVSCVEMKPLGDAPAWIEADELQSLVAPPINEDGGNRADPLDMPMGALPAYSRPGGLTWGAATYTQYLLGRYARGPMQEAASGLIWEIDETAAAALDYVLPRIETQGKRALSLLAEIWPQHRNLSFRVSGIDYATATVTIEPISIDGTGGVTIDFDAGPIKDRQIDLRRNVPGIVLTGGSSRCAATVFWDADDVDSSLIPNFTPGAASDEYLGTAIDADAENEASIWRTWEINPAWTGATWQVDGFGGAVDGLTHVDGSDGERIYAETAGAALLSVWAAKMNRGTLQGSADLPRPIALAYDPVAETAEDLTQFGILCDDQLQHISIGATIRDASELRELFTGTGKILLVSLAWTEPEPLIAWEIASPWPQGQPEIVNEQHPDLTKVRICHRCVTGIVPATGAITMADGEIVERDDAATMLALRNELAARYATVTGRASATYFEINTSIKPGDTYGAVKCRGETYSFRLVVAEVTTDPQRQTTAIRLVPIVAEESRT